MSNIFTSSSTTKSVYQRPYKSRSQRREVDRRKYDAAKDHRFLRRVFVVVGLLMAVALGIAAKGMMDKEATTPPPVAIPQ